MASHRRRNDREQGRRTGERGPAHAASAGHRKRLEESANEWLWGWHAVVAALENPARAPAKRLVATEDRSGNLVTLLGAGVEIDILDGHSIGALLPPGSVHQGIALRIPLIEPVALEDLAAAGRGFMLMLDQVTDPQNVGAIFRSAAAFGAAGVIVQDRHAPALAGALAKAAAGAIDKVPHARETNLSRALERLDGLGWRAVGLDGETTTDLAEALDGRPTVLVMGSEGEGLRRLVREHCDTLARIPMPGGFESLNVSAAAAVALYEASRPRR